MTRPHHSRGAGEEKEKGGGKGHDSLFAPLFLYQKRKKGKREKEKKGVSFPLLFFCFWFFSP